MSCISVTDIRDFSSFVISLCKSCVTIVKTDDLTTCNCNTITHHICINHLTINIHAYGSVQFSSVLFAHRDGAP